MNWYLMQAPSHYPSQCLPTSMSPYGVIWPQWVDSLAVVLNKMVNIWQILFSNAFACKKWLYIDPNYTIYSGGPIDTNWALLQAMAWHKTGGQAFIRRNGAYIHRQAWMSEEQLTTRSEWGGCNMHMIKAARQHTAPEWQVWQKL